MSFASTMRHSQPVRGRPQLPGSVTSISVTSGTDNSVMLKPEQ
jgi:hypothetical protein